MRARRVVGRAYSDGVSDRRSILVLALDTACSVREYTIFSAARQISA